MVALIFRLPCGLFIISKHVMERASSSVGPFHSIYLAIVMLIGLHALIPVALSPIIVSLSDALSFPGKWRSNLLYRAPLLRSNTEPWQVLLMSFNGWFIYFVTCKFLVANVLSYTVIIRVLFTLLLILCFTKGPST